MTETFAPLLGETALGKRLARLTEHAESLDRLRAMVVRFVTPAPLTWTSPLGAHAVAVIGPDDEECQEIRGALAAGEPLDPRVLDVDLRAGTTDGCLSTVSGVWREVAVLGPRGDGKTIMGAVTWPVFAHLHRAAGYSLPVKVMVPTDTFTSHTEKLCPSLVNPLWRGLWMPSQEEHVWTATLGGQPFVELRLFGVKDTSEQDKLRAEAHALWIEEAAPAGVESSGGLTEEALGLGITSLRLPSFHHPVLVTSNYGSEAHWSWQRYAVRQQPGTKLIRIPPGERASAEDRQSWLEALDGRPDLQRRLVHGEPALIVQGEGVLAGVWNPELHVSREPLPVVPGARTVLGHDTGLRPATVVVQEVRGQLRVLASLVTDYGGMAQHIAGVVLPWLGRNGLLGGSAVTLEHRIDPAGLVGDYGNSDESPERIIRRMLRGPVREGPVKWPPRIEPLLGVLGRMVGGQPALIVAPGPDTAVLREAAAGKWFYPRRGDGSLVRDLPEKSHPHSDAGDAWCYAVAALAPRHDRDDHRERQRYAISATTQRDRHSPTGGGYGR
jgi:hypothetical protein